MKNWEKAKVNKEMKLIEVLKVIQAQSIQFALVVDENDRLLGTITDGDVRRGILRAEGLDLSAAEIMSRSPLTIDQDMPKEYALKLMKVNKISRVPVVDAEHRVVDVVGLEEFAGAGEHENPVVILAGGLGSRLGEVTSSCPKVLLKMDDKPILQVIIERLKKNGFSNIFISVNYKSEMIKEYFRDGSEFGVKIKYLDEGKKLGTAGPLSLLEETPNLPLLVMNGDLLTKVNFDHLLKFHMDEEYDATMCVREYEVKVPFGVVMTKGKFVNKIEEKPVHRFFVNAGIYCINPNLLKSIPRDEYHDMTDFLENRVNEGKGVGIFPVHEYWMDIGQKSDLERAQQEFSKEFK